MGIRGPSKCLEDAMGTFIRRGTTYGEAYKQFGPIMMALFPTGITINNADDWNRYSCFHMVVAKLARYANSFEFGHEDSAHDIIVYGAMLESLDVAQREKREAIWDAANSQEASEASQPDLLVLEPGLCDVCDSETHTTDHHGDTSSDEEAWIR